MSIMWFDKGLDSMNSLLNKDSITSKELCKQINIFRQQESRSELEHKDLLKVIRDEFEEEIGEGKISLTSYKDVQSKERPMYILTLAQAKQVLVREHKTVRKAVIKYIEILEEQLKAQTPQISRKQQCVLTMFDDNATDQDKIIALQDIVDISRGEVCQSVITLDKVEDLIIEILKDEDIIAYMTRLQIREIFHKTLFKLKYITYKQFPSRDGKRLEKTWTKIPTNSFYEVFADKGLAVVRDITTNGDDRGKVEIIYTCYIAKWLQTDQFKRTFLDVASNVVIVPVVEEVVEE